MKEKIQIMAPIKVERKSKTRADAVASVIEFPENKQPDLLYFSAILVSSGENLNHAFFLPSELVLAEGSIVNKAVDREHKEEEVIGHIYDRVYLDKKGNLLTLEDLIEDSTIDTKDLDIAIAGIVYKNRFPKEAEEIKNGDWCISMEAYYSDFDIKIGDVMIPRKDAEALGLVIAEVVGKHAEVIDVDSKVIAEGNVARVLRNIIFAGCGIVKNPANPDSVFLEAANLKEETGETVALTNIKDKAEVENLKVNIAKEEEVVEEATEDAQQTYPDLTHTGPGGSPNDTVSQCAVFNRFDTAGNEVNWCGTYEVKCTSELREQRDPNCLYYKEAHNLVMAMLEEDSMMEEHNKKLEKINNLKRELEELIDQAAKKCGSGGKKKKKMKKAKSEEE